MLNFLPKLLLVATAFSPVLLTYSVSYFCTGRSSLGYLLLAIAAVSLCSCLFVIWQASISLPRNPVKIKSIKPADKEIVGFVLAYLLPLARGTNSAFDGINLWIALIVFFVIVMTSNAYHTNPLLSLLGFHFYEVVIEEVGYIMISRKNIHHIRSINSVISLTDYMLFDVTEKKQ